MWQYVPRDPFAIHSFSLRRKLYFTIVALIMKEAKERERERMREKDRIFVSYALNCINHIATIRSNCNDRKMDARRIKKRREKERERVCVRA